MSVEFVRSIVAELESIDVGRAMATELERWQAVIHDAANPTEQPCKIVMPDFRTSIHEAAHAVAMLRLGVACDGITHEIRGGGKAYRSQDSDCHASLDIMVSLAGPIAESWYSGLPIEYLARNGGRVDFLDARRTAESLGKDDLHATLTAYAATAVLLVDARWEEIVTVARTLLQRYTLSREELKTLLQIH